MLQMASSGLSRLIELIEEDENLSEIDTLITSEPELVNAVNQVGDTPIAVTISNNGLKRKDIVKRLLNAKANPNAGDPGEPSLLAQAVFNQQDDVVTLLVEAKASVNVSGFFEQDILFHDVVKQGNAATVSSLLEAKAELNTQNINSHDHNDLGKTALHFAVAHGHKDVVSTLCNAKANLEVKDAFGNTPLLAAVDHFSKLSTKIIYILLEAKADTSARNKQGKSFAEIAVEKHKNKNQTLNQLVTRFSFKTTNTNKQDQDLRQDEGKPLANGNVCLGSR